LAVCAWLFDVCFSFPAVPQQTADVSVSIAAERVKPGYDNGTD
jgi:hypothetical protein